MKRRKIIKRSIIIFFICLCMCVLFTNKTQIMELTDEIKKAIYGNPINEATGVINNLYFGINSDGTNAEKTTRGICEAIEYSNKIS